MSFLAPLIAAIPALIGLYQSHKERKREKESDLGSPKGQKGPSGYDTFSRFTPEQEEAFNQMIKSLTGQVGNLGENPLYQAGQDQLLGVLGGDTEKFEAPLLRQFNEKIVPGLAEQFAGAGAGAQSSSAFQQALGAAGANLTERLASLRGELGLKAADLARGYTAQPLEALTNLVNTSAKGYAPKEKGVWESATPGLIDTSLKEGLKYLSEYFQNQSNSSSPKRSIQEKVNNITGGYTPSKLRTGQMTNAFGDPY